MMEILGLSRMCREQAVFQVVGTNIAILLDRNR